mmetsp:Transcript_14753/g.20225  ORF Transcript_14753/g.20225 Transcript_14753/m.20225 type:complete len:95 (-) Transcript_14753:7-291(-)
MTRILSQCTTEDKRCATVIVVLLRAALRKVSTISLSAKASTDDVTSSHRINEGSRKMALAMATFCRSPPERRAPRSPTTVSNPTPPTFLRSSCS